MSEFTVRLLSKVAVLRPAEIVWLVDRSTLRGVATPPRLLVSVEVISVLLFSGRSSPVIESAVANEVPEPEELLSTTTQGMMPLFKVPAAPVCPVKAKPPVEDCMVPVLSPRTSMVPVMPPLLVARVTEPVTKLACRPVSVKTVCPAFTVNAPTVSVVAAEALP